MAVMYSAPRMCRAHIHRADYTGLAYLVTQRHGSLVELFHDSPRHSACKLARKLGPTRFFTRLRGPSSHGGGSNSVTSKTGRRGGTLRRSNSWTRDNRGQDPTHHESTHRTEHDDEQCEHAEQHAQRLRRESRHERHDLSSSTTVRVVHRRGKVANIQ